MVCDMKPKALMTPMNHLKRRHLSISTKKRNVRHKFALNQVESNNCAFCEFRTTSKAKMIRHMKMLHTSQSNPLTPKILVEDMSLCETSEEELLLTEPNNMCDLADKTEKELKEHIPKKHSQEIPRLEFKETPSKPQVVKSVDSLLQIERNLINMSWNTK